MDKIDQKILQILQQDAGITNVALAEKINLSPSSCLRRVQHLKKTGVIQKTVCILDEKYLGHHLKAIISVDLDRHGNQAKEALLAQIKSEPSVQQAYSISGESDLLLILHLADMEECQKVCERLFNHNQNVIRYRTSFVMEEVKR